MAFPTLTRKPSFPLPKKPLDTDLKSGFEGGYEQARPRYTRDLFEWDVKYPFLLAADKSSLETHVAAVKSTVIFTWTNPDDGQTYNVRYLKRPEIVLAGKLGNGEKYYATEFTLRMA